MTSDVRLGRVVGLPAILGSRMIGRVERAIPEESGRQLRGLVIRRGLGSARWVSREDVGMVGDVSVILRRIPVRLPVRMLSAPRTVTDESGLTLGRVTDAWINPETLAITGLEITLGPTEDLLRGRLRVTQWAMQPGDDGTAQVLIPRESWQSTPDGQTPHRREGEQ